MKKLSTLVNEKDRIVKEAEIIVLKRIERYCKRYNRTFKNVGTGPIVYKGADINNGEEVEDANPYKWVKYFEDNFSLFPFCLCQCGKWIAGSTRLIKFRKPRL